MSPCAWLHYDGSAGEVAGVFMPRASSRPTLRETPRTHQILLAVLLLLPVLAALEGTGADDPAPPPDGTTVLQGPMEVSGHHLTYANSTIVLNGNITIGEGGGLFLTRVDVRMGGPTGQVITVLPGGVLSLNAVTIAPASGMPIGSRFGIEVQPEGYVYIRSTRIEGLGAGGWGAGLEIRSDLGSIEDSTFLGDPVAATFAGVVGEEFRNVTFHGSGTDDLSLVEGSNITLRDSALPRVGISSDSLLGIRSALTLRFRDSHGTPARFVDVQVTTPLQSEYATAGYGGGDPYPSYTLLGVPTDPAVAVRSREYRGSAVATVYPVTIDARYAEWSDHRTFPLEGARAESFTYHLETTAFTNVTAASGVTGNPRFDGDTFGPGGAWGDFDNDGWEDLYVTDSRTLGVFFPLRTGPNYLYHNNGDGTFTELSRERGAAGNGSWGTSWVDYDNDGDLDLYLTSYGEGATFYSPGQPNILFKNLLMETGHARFDDVTAQAGVGGEGHSTSAAWADYDNDGCLDLYVANLGIMNHMTWWIRNESNVLYRNNCDGTFTDVTAAAGDVYGGGSGPGMGAPEKFWWAPIKWQGDQPDYSIDWTGDLARDNGPAGMTFALAWFDANKDGWIDLLVGNDHGLNAYYQNDGDGTFTDLTMSAGFGLIGSGMGLAVGDYDRDGWLDVYQTNFNPDFLWRNRGDGSFEEVGWSAKVLNNLVGWGTGFIDYDNDGTLDLFVGNGRVYTNQTMTKVSKPPAEPDQLFRNDGNGTFSDVSADSGVDIGLNTMGAAFADFDNDGFMDIYTGHTDGPETLLRNNGNGNSWIKIRPVGTVSNRDGVGLWAKVTADGITQTSQKIGGGSYLTSPVEYLHFGLATAQVIPTIVLHWPSGIVQTLTEVPVNQTLEVVEPAPFAADAGPDRTVTEGTPVIFDGNGTRYLAPAPAVAFRREMTWTFSEDGVQTVLTGMHPVHAFRTPGAYTVTLRADDGAGTARTSTMTITVLDSTGPQVDPGPDMTVMEGTAVVLDGGNTTDNDPDFPAGSVYQWTFVDGEAGRVLDGPVARWTFRTPGDHVVTLDVVDLAGNAATGTRIITVLDGTPPTLAATPTVTVRAGIPVDFNASGILDNDPDFNRTGTIAWNFSIGGTCPVPVTLYGRRAQYTFEDPGTHVVTVTATDAAGWSTNGTFVIEVSGGPSTSVVPDWLTAATAPLLGDATLLTGFVLLLVTIVTAGWVHTVHRRRQRRRGRRWALGSERGQDAPPRGRS